MDLEVGIMTHPARLAYAEEMQDILEEQRVGLGAQVPPIRLVVDEKAEGPWLCSRKFWASIDPSIPQHLLLQDDLLFCSDFLPAVAMLSRLQLSNPVTYYLPTVAQSQALARGKHWVSVRRFLGGQAFQMPAFLVPQMLQWIDANEGTDPEWKKHDDYRVQCFFKAHGIRCMATAPSLVEHRTEEMVSLMKHQPKVFGRWRKAKVFIGEHARAMEIDWSKGLDDPLKG